MDSSWIFRLIGCVIFASSEYIFNFLILRRAMFTISHMKQTNAYVMCVHAKMKAKASKNVEHDLSWKTNTLAVFSETAELVSSSSSDRRVNSKAFSQKFPLIHIFFRRFLPFLLLCNHEVRHKNDINVPRVIKVDRS